MRPPVQAALLLGAALMLVAAATVNATVAVPHLREDLLELAVRPRLLATVVLGLHLGTFALAALAAVVLGESVKAFRSVEVARLPLGVIAVTCLVFGIFAFRATHSHHALGYVAVGALIFAAIARR